MRLVFGVLALAPLAAFAQSLTPSQDAYYVPGSGTNYGTASTITVGSSSSVGLVQFDLSSLPAGVTANQVQKATLTLFLDHVGASGAISVYTVSAATLWSELTVNGNSPPAAGPVVKAMVAAAAANTFLTVDATAAVQSWITSPVSNNGFMILGNGGTSVQFDSKENTNTSHPATLSIVLATAGPAGAPGANGHSVLNGTAAPAAGIGADGDFYLQMPSMCMYGPKAAGTWPTPCASLVGPAGALSTHIEFGTGGCTGVGTTIPPYPGECGGPTAVGFTTPFPSPPQCTMGLTLNQFLGGQVLSLGFDISSVSSTGFTWALSSVVTPGDHILSSYNYLWVCHL